MIRWIGKETVHSETFDRVLQAELNGRRVAVYISREATEEHGIDACRVVAERKILEATFNGRPPPNLSVTTGDFAGA